MKLQDKIKAIVRKRVTLDFFKEGSLIFDLTDFVLTREKAEYQRGYEAGRFDRQQGENPLKP